MNKTTNAQAANKETEVVAAIVSAIVAMGYSQNQIASIRPVVSNSWRLASRVQAQKANKEHMKKFHYK